MKLLSPRPILIDTDVDIDDWMAILYLLKHPGAKVIGLTTTGCGAAHLTPGTRNARNLLTLTGDTHIPVAQGTSRPLLYSNQFPNAIRDGLDTVFGLTLPENPVPLDPRPAAQFLYETLMASSEPVTVLAIGGLTNLGTLLRDHPDVVPHIERVVVMGGAVDAPGNIYNVDNNYLNKVAEWNIFLDVLGAKITFESGVPITLVPLDASQFVPLNRAFYERLAGRATTRAARFILDALTEDMAFVLSGDFFFWDPLAAAILMDPSLAHHTRTPASPQRLSLEVVQELDEENDSSGQLVRSLAGAPMDVALWADADTFTSHFLDVLNLPDRL